MDLTTLIHQTRVTEWNYVYAQWRMELFSLQWWTIVALVTAAYVVWWKLTDKSRLSHLLLFGSFVAVMRVLFDDVVVGMGLYSYPTRIMPLPRSLFTNDLTIIPLGYMLVYQFSSSWKSFFIGAVIWSGVWSFVFKPLFVMLGILVIHDWQHYYTFIASTLIGVLSRFAFLLVMSVEQGCSALRSVGVNKTILQPAMKPLDNTNSDDDNHNN